MPTFQYVARTLQGKEVKGSIDADDRSQAMQQLRTQQLIPLTLDEKKSFSWGNLKNMQFGGPHVKLDEMVLFTRQMATMIGAGIPLLEALEIMEEQVDNKGFKRSLGILVDDVRGGSDLSESMRKHSKIFPEIYVNMIKAGEASGQLDDILDRLAGYMEATAKLRSEIKSAMTYPVISLLMILGITVFLLVKIVPKFQEVFNQLEVELPLPTQITLSISHFIQNSWWMIVAGLGVFIASVSFWRKTKSGKYQFDWLTLKLPVFGPLIQKVALSRFSKTFATLIKSGVPILGALEIVAATAGNQVVTDATTAAKESVRQGETLSGPLSKSPVFPPMVVRMIAIGEKSGALETLLEKISEFYDQQVEATVAALTSLIEPLMIGVMGFIVGGIVLSIFLPIFKIQESLMKGG